MRAIRSADLIVLAALAGIVGWAVYRSTRRVPPSPPPAPSAPNAEPPLVEFREVRWEPGGETGSLLTIDRSGLATLQMLPLGPGSKTTRIYLGCDEFAGLPEGMRYELDELRSSYGSEHAADRGEVSVVSRFGGRERKVVWRNPESSPKPPEGVWAGLVAPLEDIRREAQETSKSAEPGDEIVVEYGQLSSGIVATYFTLLSIHKSGQVSLGHGLGAPWPQGAIQLTPEELANLLRTVEDAKFMGFRRCYGKHATVNPQNSWITYQRNGTGKIVTWMSDPADPKPPDGWFRIVEILNQIRARVEKQAKDTPAPSPHG